ncbi:alpha/beta hydrolase [Salibacterium halotolerans]|uniref:Enterochelin esterase n=1 Tax=Salibacterium halotolerans TaxID=1884432 RepID=A0A1I5TBT6_9BACI|nr:alpha/beta hydrolase-fold protein [Salibacterium halotolerans]SFP80490.1 Enterochelin esterase [Salibacterium halotolerans]
MNGTMKALPFYSSVLDYMFELPVYLPPYYSPLYTYHLAITQDGRDYFQLGKIGRKMEAAMEDGAEETIVVGVPHPGIQMRREWYHPAGSGSRSYMNFLVSELLPFLEQTYPTYQLPYGRMLMGDSLGGTISLLTALHYPNTFARIMMHSPLINEDVLRLVSEHNAWKTFDIYHSIGNQETDVHTTDGKVVDFLSPNRRLSRLFRQENRHYHYDELDGGHNWAVWEKDLPRALHFMLQS